MMIVKLIAHTILEADAANDSYAMEAVSDYQGHYDPEVMDADELAEMAGRLCYKSWNRPNPATATNAGYLANILDHKHFSVLEHASASFYIAGVSRSLTHELVRHRHLSFSQVSQRYVDESAAESVMTDEVSDCISDSTKLYIEHLFTTAKTMYKQVYEEMICQGASKKAARGAARMVLPNMTETALIVTGNHTAWREVVAKRNSPAADGEIRELAGELLEQLKIIAPNTYQDMS